jgi:hypothetical protein
MPRQNVPERTAERSLREEARETSGVTSALLLSYLDREGGRDAVLEVLRRCDLEGCEAELRDENSWFSWETKIALFEATAAVLDEPDFLSEMASFALDANVAGGLKVALRTLGSPQFVFRNIVRANARFVRSHVLELLKLEEGHALLRFATTAWTASTRRVSWRSSRSCSDWMPPSSAIPNAPPTAPRPASSSCAGWSARGRLWGWRPGVWPWGRQRRRASCFCRLRCR